LENLRQPLGISVMSTFATDGPAKYRRTTSNGDLNSAKNHHRAASSEDNVGDAADAVTGKIEAAIIRNTKKQTTTLVKTTTKLVEESTKETKKVYDAMESVRKSVEDNTTEAKKVYDTVNSGERAIHAELVKVSKTGEHLAKKNNSQGVVLAKLNQEIRDVQADLKRKNDLIASGAVSKDRIAGRVVRIESLSDENSEYMKELIKKNDELIAKNEYLSAQNNELSTKMEEMNAKLDTIMAILLNPAGPAQ